jgi:hypothetical protein
MHTPHCMTMHLLHRIDTFLGALVEFGRDRFTIKQIGRFNRFTDNQKQKANAALSTPFIDDTQALNAVQNVEQLIFDESETFYKKKFPNASNRLIETFQVFVTTLCVYPVYTTKLKKKKYIDDLPEGIYNRNTFIANLWPIAQNLFSSNPSTTFAEFMMEVQTREFNTDDNGNLS